MRTRIGVVAALALVVVAARAEGLKKLSLDDAASASPRIEVDTHVKVEGASALKITTHWPTTICSPLHLLPRSVYHYKPTREIPIPSEA